MAVVSGSVPPCFFMQQFVAPPSNRITRVLAICASLPAPFSPAVRLRVLFPCSSMVAAMFRPSTLIFHHHREEPSFPRIGTAFRCRAGWFIPSLLAAKFVLLGFGILPASGFVFGILSSLVFAHVIYAYLPSSHCGVVQVVHGQISAPLIFIGEECKSLWRPRLCPVGQSRFFYLPTRPRPPFPATEVAGALMLLPHAPLTFLFLCLGPG